MPRFRLIPERSAVVIEATSSVHPIHSRTQGLEGYVDLDVDESGRVRPGSGSKGEISLAVSRLASGNPVQDIEMRRRIDARRFPTIDGEVTAMKETGTEGKLRVVGTVTFRGVTQSHEDDLVFTLDDEGELTIEGESVFDVRDFGMQPPRILMLRVHPDVKVRLEAVAVRDD